MASAKTGVDGQRQAPRLSASTLASLPAGVTAPAYDRSAVTPGIVHVGVGAFCRAHTAVFTDAVLAAGARDWGIVGANLRSDDVRAALAPQDFLYTLMVREPAGDRPRVIGSLLDVLTASVNPEAVVQAMADPRIRIVSLTVTEKGYCQDAATGTLAEDHPAVIADLANPAAAPRSVPGLLVEAIRRRQQAGTGPFTVLVCDNLSQNGAKIRRIVTRFAELRDPALARFIADNVSFPCTMVDRITPATRDEDRAAVAAALGVEDAWPVVTEPFHQWVIEDDFRAGRPRWEDAGAIIAKDVTPFEVMKLRCLNGAHSSLAYIGTVAGLETVSECMQDDGLLSFIRRLWGEDIGPTVPPVPGTSVADYTKALEERFRNPAIRHRIIQISMDGSQKLPPRWLEPALEAMRAGREVRHVAFAVAAWMRFLLGADDQGRTYDVSDPLAARLFALCDAAGRDAGRLAEGLFSVGEIFSPELLSHQDFRARVVRNLKAILADGMRPALAAHLRGDLS